MEKKINGPETLIQWRRWLGLSQMRLAKESGISRFRISLFETGYIETLSHYEIGQLETTLKKCSKSPRAKSARWLNHEPLKSG